MREQERTLDGADAGMRILPLSPLDLAGFSGPEGWRRLKYIPLSDNPGKEAFLSLGGHLRQRVTFFDDALYGAIRPNGDWFFTGRIHLHADFHYERFRAFVELATARDAFASVEDDPLEENNLSFNQAFIGAEIGERAQVEVGRMEWRYGSQRLIAVRDGTNVRRRFDGLRTSVQRGGWRIDGLFGYQVELDPGVFDDEFRSDDGLWGIYATGQLPGLPGGLDLYYLGTDFEAVSINLATGNETRHSFGARLFGHQDGWDWDVEAVYQAGDVTDFRLGDGSISAWTVASTTGYTFATLPMSPRLALSANVASGDGDPDNADVGSFNALFPRGSYFSEAAVLGPRNFYNIHPFLTISPADDVTLGADVNFFWRLKRSDGVYDPAGQLIRGPGNSSARFVDTSLSLTAAWQVNPFLFVSALYTHKWAGRFIEETGLASDTSFAEFTLRFTF